MIRSETDTTQNSSPLEFVAQFRILSNTTTASTFASHTTLFYVALEMISLKIQFPLKLVNKPEFWVMSLTQK